MGALFRKEMRGLLPFAALLLLIYTLDAFENFFLSYPDQHSLSSSLRYDENGQFVLFVLIFTLAAGLLVREIDEGTLAFLDGLPVSRSRIFGAKLLAALTLLLCQPVLDFSTSAVLWLCSRNSLDSHFPLQLLLITALLEAASLLVYLSVGLALSFLRQFSWLVLGTLMASYMYLDRQGTPLISMLNIFRLTRPIYQGRQQILPGTELAAQLALAAACLIFAYAAFLLQGDGAQRLRDGVGRHPLITALSVVATGISVVIWIGVLSYGGESDEPPDKLVVTYTRWPTVQANTAHYQFLYPENRETVVTALMDRADSAEAIVRRFLGVTPIAEIQADLTGSVVGHAGLAHWKTVHIDLHQFEEEPDELLPVLGHETTHVYIDHSSDSRLSDVFNSTRFFHEGLATYVQYHLFGNQQAERLARLRRVAAVARARDEVRFEQLTDSRALGAVADTDLVYPLGEIFVSALVDRYGPNAPGKIVKAFNRASARHDLEGETLWQDVFQACGYNLSEVEEGFFKTLDRSVVEQRKFSDSLPRLHGGVETKLIRLIVHPLFEGDAPGKVMCRFRPAVDTASEFYMYPGATKKDGSFQVDRSLFPHQTFWYQLGWLTPQAGQIVWEPWTEAPVR